MGAVSVTVSVRVRGLRGVECSPSAWCTSVLLGCMGKIYTDNTGATTGWKNVEQLESPL